MIKWTYFLPLLLSLFCSATASFLYGQACSERNTAYLTSSTWIIPNNETNCVDITGSGNPDLVNYTAFFQLVLQADTLYADHMNLSNFPGMIHLLPRLETIDVSGNNIRRLPIRMYKFAPRVTKLLMAENAVFVPRKRPLFKSVTIETLMLCSNRIANIYPITFSKMPSLKVLYLDGNRLKYIHPEMFAPMIKLQYLHLGHNAISKVPPKELMPNWIRFYIVKDQITAIK